MVHVPLIWICQIGRYLINVTYSTQKIHHSFQCSDNVAHMAQIKSIEYLGAPLVSTLMPIRLGSAFVMSVLIMAEGLTSLAQVFGTLYPI